MSGNSYHVVTTCNADGWQRYGKRMVETFKQFWPSEVELILYNEGFDAPDNIMECEFPGWHFDFKKRHANNPAAHGNDRHVNRRNRAHDYRYDCVRFSHKVAAITDIGLDLHSGFLIWIDADTVTFDTVTVDWLDSLFSEKRKSNQYIAWLKRDRKYPECGFLIFDCNHSAHEFFMSRLSELYKTDRVFNCDETHDSFIIEQLVKFFHDRGIIGKPFDLSGSEARKSTHPFVLSRLGEKMDHLKGPIKHKERKTPRQWVKGREEEYWK